MTDFDTPGNSGKKTAMEATSAGHPDSRMHGGGNIPGLPGARAFVLRAPSPSSIPVLIAAPHGGRRYPDAVLAAMRNPEYAALKLEDRYVDRLAEAVADATGAALLVARAPRAMIDLNRAPDDIDWGMVERSGGGTLPAARSPGGRASSGLGLIPRRLPGLGEIWKQRHGEDVVATRIAAIHVPYHVAVGQALSAIRARWGAALLLDLHSMPSLARRGGVPAAEFVLGDRFGTSCHGSMLARAFAHFGQAGRLVAHNRPYAGGYVLDRHGDVAGGIHAVQVEVDRASYLDSQLREPGPGFDAIVAILAGLVAGLADAVAGLGAGLRAGLGAPERWAEAAE